MAVLVVQMAVHLVTALLLVAYTVAVAVQIQIAQLPVLAAQEVLVQYELCGGMVVRTHLQTQAI